jgi:hypothetical protein
MYVEGYDGQRVICSHPCEDLRVERVLGIPLGTLSALSFIKPKWWWLKRKKEAYKANRAISDAAYARTGFLSDCMCVDCLQKQKLDLKKDERKCCRCSSANVKSVIEMRGSACPQCKKGMIVEIETGLIT